MQSQLLVLVLVGGLVQGARADSDGAKLSKKPVESMMEYLPMGNSFQLPNTVVGLDRDLDNVYQSLAPKGLLANGYSMLNQNLISPLQSVQQAASQGYQASADEMVRALEWFRNPEQMCRQMAHQVQQSYQSAQSKASQYSDSAGSMLSRFGLFGRK